MRIFEFNSRTRALIEDIAKTEPKFCGGATGPNCTAHVIATKFKEFSEKNHSILGEYKNIQREFDFVQSVANSAYNDGRSCPGPEQISLVASLLSDDWRKHFNVVSIGLRQGVITLEPSDLQLLSLNFQAKERP